ncbi:TolC family protein [Chitinophaga sp.]|uniref:TolC family protein n=1 Tax=Chitinophaga sp. TaxID=1869181 RepID=UPI0031D8796C
MYLNITAKRCAALLCLLAGISGHCFAQTLPLKQAIDMTLQHYPALKVKNTIANAATAHTTDVKHEWWPNLKLVEEATVGTDNGVYGSYFPMSIIPSTSGGIRDANSLQAVSGNIGMAQLQWEVYNFGLYKVRRDEARQQQQVAGADAGITANDLTVSVIQDYLSMLEYYNLMRIQADNIERTRSVSKAVTSIVLHGLKPGVDSAIAAAELSKARLNYIDFQNGYNKVRMHLASLTGLDSAMIMPDTLYDKGLRQLLLAQSDTATVEQTHPALVYYNALLQQNKIHELVIRKTAMPKVTLMAAGWARGSSINSNDTYNSLAGGFGYSRYNYLAGVGITYNVADIFHTKDKMREQYVRTRAAASQLEASHTLLDNQLNQARVNIHTALDKLNEMPAQLNAARAAAAQKMALYRGGLTNIIDVTNALYVLNRAENDLIQTRHDAWQSLFMEAFATNSIQALVQQLEAARVQ